MLFILDLIHYFMNCVQYCSIMVVQQLLALLLVLITPSECGIAKLDINNAGEYNVLVNNELWLTSAPVFFRVDNSTHSLQDHTLEKVGYETGKGNDSLGHFNFIKYTLATWFNHFFELWIKDYTVKGNNFFTFDQVFLNNTNGTEAEDCETPPWYSFPGSLTCYNRTSSAFPSFYIGKHSTSRTLGFLSFAGEMIGDTRKQIGLWNETTTLIDGMESGPLVIFDEHRNSLLISPLNQFMTSSLWHQKSSNRINWGTMGGVTDIPEGFTMRTILVFEPGINKAFNTLNKAYKRLYLQHGIKRTFQARDKTLSHLGYWTDNGAYYYYHRETVPQTGWNITYDQTLMDVRAYADKIKVPYNYLQIDSWWYYEGDFFGVKEWRDRWDVFPGGGMKFVSDKTKWPLAAQNKYWDSGVVYSKKNGGQYNFVEEFMLAVPDDPMFWTHLLQEAKNWSLILYEQDWMSIQMMYTHVLQTDLTLGERWLQQMNDAAQNLNISMQYSMSLPKQALQSMTLSAVTQARVSEDYHLNKDQWKIGISSIFADSLGLVPFKDTFWTRPEQPRNPRYENITEPYPALQGLVATISTGPVGPGDMIGGTDRELLMRCCNADGLILKPNHPARAIDQQIIKMAIPHSSGPTGEVWTTYTTIPMQSNADLAYFGTLFAADMDDDYTIYPNMTGFPSPLSDNTIVYSHSNVYNNSMFNDAHPLHLTGCTKENFCLYYFSNVFYMNGTDISLFGEMNKWVPVSRQRITRIMTEPISLSFDIAGAVNEEVSMYYWQEGNVMEITCRLGASGHAEMRTSIPTCIQVTPG